MYVFIKTYENDSNKTNENWGKKEYAENLNSVYKSLNINNILSLIIKDYFQLLFYSSLYSRFC